MEWLFWLVLIAIGVTFQLIAVWQRNRPGMLTTYVRWLSLRLWGRIIVYPLWLWLTFHWFLEQWLPGGPGVWYPVAITAGIVAAFVVDYQDMRESAPDLLDKVRQDGTL